MPQVEIDKDLAATMTPEELEAINAEASPDELEVMRQHKAAQSDDGDDEDDEDPAPDDVPAAAAEEDPTPATEAIEADPAPVQTAPDTQFKSALPADFAQRVDAVQSESSALAQKYRDGELDFDAYTAQMAEVQARRDALNEERIKASVLDEINQQTTAKEASRAVNAFFDQTSKSDKIDYRKDESMREDLIGFVERLEQRPEFAGKPLADLMAEAHRRVMAMHGKVATPADPIKTAKDSRKPPIDAIPKTLAQVPGGDGPGDVADEFGSLDALDGLDLETALAKLSPSQRDRYLRAA